MIHQFIFAGPKPGLSADAFTSYWINFHAVDYAAKIPQIRQYLVASRVHIDGDREVPLFEGLAEIWLANEAEQIASLQTPEFLQGARMDEPRWAAFWQTFVLDTDERMLKDYAGVPLPEFAKLYLLLKRSPELQLESFRDLLVSDRSRRGVLMPGLERHLIGFARDALYGLGEPRLDAIEVLSFRSVEEIVALSKSADFTDALQSLWALVDKRYFFTFVGRENWIIRPGSRR